MMALHRFQDDLEAASAAGRPHHALREDGIDLRALIGALRRRRAIILATVLALTSLAALIALAIPPRYTATSALVFGPGEAHAVDMRTAVEGPAPEGSAIETQVKVLTSRSHARRVMEELGLARDPEFGSADRADRLLSALRGLRDRLARGWVTATGVADRPDEPPGAGESYWGVVPGRDASTGGRGPTESAVARSPDAAPTEAALDRFLDGLAVSQDGQSRVISVSFTAADPEKAALIANAVVRLYIGEQLDAKVRATNRAGRWLAERVEQLRAEVLQTERAAEEYRAANELMDGRDGTLSAQQLASLNAELIVARVARTASEARLQRARELREGDAGYASLAEVASAPIIVALRQQEAQLLREEAQLAREYGGRHPRIIQLRAEKENLAAKISQEIANVVRGLEDEVAVARSRERALEEGLEQAKDRSALTGAAAVQLRELERAASSTRSLYEMVLTRLKEIQEQAGLLEPDARVISTAAVPDEPSFPRPVLMTAVGFTASLVLGTLLAALVEHLDRGVRTGQQVEQVLGLRGLAYVPRVRRLGRRRRPHRYLLEKPLSDYAEAVNAIHTGMRLPSTGASPRVVLVTSTLPGEGKTTLAMSLGASMARSGRKTLVMDLDLRNPSIARELGQPVDAGLLEFMAGERNLDEIIWRDPSEPNLHAIPVKRRTTRPTDLLGSYEMRALMNLLRGRYEYIVLDSPPALGFTDSRVAAMLADVVLFVVQWEKTTEEVVANGLASLTGTDIRIAGAVLTQVDVRRHVRYGYNDVSYYYGKYREYYVN